MVAPAGAPPAAAPDPPREIAMWKPFAAAALLFLSAPARAGVVM